MKKRAVVKIVLPILVAYDIFTIDPQPYHHLYLRIGGTNANGILQAGTAAINYTAADGTTTFGGSAGTYGGLTWLADGATTTLNVTGGTINFDGAFSNDSGTESVWVGNGGFYTANLVINGGAVNSLNGTLLGRDNATGIISVSNGSYTTGAFNSSIGLSINLQNNFGSGSVNIGNGGLFDVAGAALQPIEFQALSASAANTTSDFINFTTGSTGKLELNLSTATLGSSYFSDLVTNGYIEVNGGLDTTLSDFSINTSTLSASTLALASAPTPEPSTWALMLGGAAMLVVLQRRRSLKA